MIQRVLNIGQKQRVLSGSIDKKSFKNLAFVNDYDNLVRQYDLRMWYISNSPHSKKCIQYVHELEKIHNELNYLNIRDMIKRFLIFTVLFYGFYQFYEQPNYDWQDYYEPKHELNVYGDLIEGGDEGDDD